MTGGTQNELEDRFGYLLQPIRDLAKSWEVDIASYLTDYLDELDKVTITFDDGRTTMNFAEAALLIQGSACVYSKKVENLYCLVYQVMDVISNKKNKQKKTTNQDGEVVDDGMDDDDDEFYSLDDLPVGKNITMKEGDKTILPVKRTPLAIIPLGNSERGQNPLLSKKGEVLGSRDDFKMNTCYIHKTGAMLLDVSYMSLLITSLQLPAHVDIMSNNTGHTIEQEKSQQEQTEQTPEHMEQDAAPADITMEAPPLFENDHDENSPPPSQLPDRTLVKDRLRVRKPILEKVVHRKPLSELFKELDPYSVSEKPDKNIGRGKIIKTPPELKEEENKKRKRKTATEKAKIPISVFIQNTCFSHHEKYTKTVFNTPMFAAFENQFWKEHLRRKQIWAQEKKLLRSVNSKQLEEFENDREEQLPEDNEFGCDNNDDDDGCDGGYEAPNLENFHQNPHLSLLGDFDIREDNLTSYEELARQYIEKFMACGNNFHTTEIAQKVAEWEEKIIPRLEEEERRDPFDIHVYGSKILDNLPAETNRIKFAKLVTGMPDFEICRLFSALLQLVNGMNVKIHKDADHLKSMDQFELELLSLKRHHEELANCQYEVTNVVSAIQSVAAQ